MRIELVEVEVKFKVDARFAEKLAKIKDWQLLYAQYAFLEEASRQVGIKCNGRTFAAVSVGGKRLHRGRCTNKFQQLIRGENSELDELVKMALGV